MASYKQHLFNNEVYHLFNRSIGKVSIFNRIDYLNKIIEIVNFYRFSQRIKLSRFNLLTDSEKVNYTSLMMKNSPLVELYSYSFMPNHYHFLIKQIQNQGITKFLSNMQNSFAKYFNLKNDRTGSLFQKSFKAKRITTNEEFIHVSRYIHLNPVTAEIIEFDQLAKYDWTSLPCYLNKTNLFINTESLIDYFKTAEKYLKFLSNNANYQRKLKKIKRLLID